MVPREKRSLERPPILGEILVSAFCKGYPRDGGKARFRLNSEGVLSSAF